MLRVRFLVLNLQKGWTSRKGGITRSQSGVKSENQASKNTLPTYLPYYHSQRRHQNTIPLLTNMLLGRIPGLANMSCLLLCIHSIPRYPKTKQTCYGLLNILTGGLGNKAKSHTQRAQNLPPGTQRLKAQRYLLHLTLPGTRHCCLGRAHYSNSQPLAQVI